MRVDPLSILAVAPTIIGQEQADLVPGIEVREPIARNMIDAVRHQKHEHEATNAALDLGHRSLESKPSTFGVLQQVIGRDPEDHVGYENGQ
jgi:hypothetical protein